MRRLLMPALAVLASACIVAPARHAHHPPPAPPPARGHPAQAHYGVAHPRTALDGPAAASVAQDYAFRRGVRTEVQNFHRDGDSWRVMLKAHGEHKGHLKLLVHAFSAQVSVLDDAIRRDDRGGGHGHGHGGHDARHHYEGN